MIEDLYVNGMLKIIGGQNTLLMQTLEKFDGNLCIKPHCLVI